jgi:hypothetical protein
MVARPKATQQLSHTTAEGEILNRSRGKSNNIQIKNGGETKPFAYLLFS